MVLLLVNLTGCITYYRTDAFSGINPPTLKDRNTIKASFSRYNAKSYFDGRDDFPHSSTESAQESQFTRDEVMIEYTRDIGHSTRLVVLLPASRVEQDGRVDGNWRVEHLWIGTLHMRADRKGALLLGLGLPLAGGVGGLRSATSDEAGDARLAAMTVFANGFEDSRAAYHARVGAIAHLGNGDYDGSIYELQGEAHFAPALGAVHLGLRLDAKFTLISDDSDSTPLSRDAVAIGPLIHWTLSDRIGMSVQYRQEVFGYFASSGSGIRLNLESGF